MTLGLDIRIEGTKEAIKVKNEKLKESPEVKVKDFYDLKDYFTYIFNVYNKKSINGMETFYNI